MKRGVTLNSEKHTTENDKQTKTVAKEKTTHKTTAKTTKVTKDAKTKKVTDKTKQDELAAAQAKIADLQKQLDETNDKYLRAIAENRNMNERFKKERQQLLKYDGQKLAKDILPIVDNLERALATEVSDENGAQLKKGIQMVYDNLNKALKDHDIVEIKAAGQKFDPNFHQAVQTAPAEAGQDSDMVVAVLQKGYQLKDRVLRPAMVIVSQ